MTVIKSKRVITLLSSSLLLIVLLFIGKLILGEKKPVQEVEVATIKVFYEEIPGSKYHSPDGTWWGYNQSKIARYEDLVFAYVIENSDDNIKTSSKFAIYKKAGNGSWEKGAQFTTTRPGNILIDSQGVLHAFVFQATNVEKNDSIGKLTHYWFPNSADGDINNFNQKTVVGPIDETESVNIRVGAAIGKDDTILVAFGLTDVHLYPGHSEHVYYKKPDEAKWKHDVAGINLGHDFFYPYVLTDSKNNFHLVSIQDDLVKLGETNIYQKIMYFGKTGGSWEKKLIVDYTKHQLASKRRALLEVSDLFEDSEGNIHLLYKEFLDKREDFGVSAFKHLELKNGKWEELEVPHNRENINWLRLFEVSGDLYYLATSSDEVFVGGVGTDRLTKLEIPRQVKGIYPYIASPKTGTNSNEEYLDVLLLSGDSQSYPNATNFYLRIALNELSKIN